MKIDTQNPEQQMVLDLIKNTNESFHLTGKAGTGKSTLIKLISENSNKNIVILAPTGIAAINVNGSSIHSFHQFPNRPMLIEDSVIRRFKPSSEKRKVIQEMDLLIIDEISMVSANLIDAIDWSLRRNTGNRKIPFGGKQVVFVGDLFQLKPVINDKDKEFMKRHYKDNFYFFNAEAFKTFKLYTIYLKKVYRQNDLNFISILDRLKVNRLNPYDLPFLNKNVITPTELSNMEYIITLTTTNKMASDVNLKQLSKLKTNQFQYGATVSGKYPKDIYPTDFILNLKVGAQIIFISNDKKKRWVNGTIGIIHELTKNSIQVKLENGLIHNVKKEIQQNNEYAFDFDKFTYKPKVVGRFKQFPVKLAWAMTIHRSQSKTFQKVIIDFGTNVFSEGQVYVALSRATSLNNIYLKRPIRPRDIFVDPKIIDFVSTIDNEVSYNSLIELSKKGSRRWYKE